MEKSASENSAVTANTAESDLEIRLNQVIGNIRNLPTPPIVFEQIQKKINNPNVSVKEIAAILSEDPAMSLKILKLTNSAFYGLAQEIDSVNHAVMIVGLDAVKNLVLSASVLGMFKANNKNKRYHEYFWRHSLASALMARRLAGEYEKGRILSPDTAFTSGLIHDIGKMIIYSFLTDEFEQIQQYMKENADCPELKAETIILGYSHAQLGRQLAKTWKLPERMADTIGYHHSPHLENNSDNYAHLICLADYIAHLGMPWDEEQGDRVTAPEASLEFFGMDEENVEQVKSILTDEYMKADTFLAMAGKH